jgi:hypothetical protein
MYHEQRKPLPGQQLTDFSVNRLIDSSTNDPETPGRAENRPRALRAAAQGSRNGRV